MDNVSKTNNYLLCLSRDVSVLDEAWDAFMEYTGEKKIKTPLTKEQFEEILLIVDRDKKLIAFKDQILYSFQYDSYAWPLVEKRK